MKRMEASISIAAVIALCAAAQASAVTVVKVRMIVGDHRYDWKDATSIPRRAEGGFTAPAAIASFLGIAPGDSMSAVELERRRAAAEYRLNDSGYFYKADVFTVPAASEPDGRVVTVRVVEGFPWRFGGGEYFAFIGQDNVSGERKSWRVFAGYDLDGFCWSDDSVNESPFTLRAGVFYSNTLGSDVLAYHLFEAALSAGVRLGPDFRIFLDSPVRYYKLVPGDSTALDFCPDTESAAVWLPGAGVEWETVSRSPGSRTLLRGESKLNLPVLSVGGAYATAETLIMFELASLYSPPAGKASDGPGIAFSFSCGGAWHVSGGLPAYALFDLSEDPLHSVRSGYPTAELLASGFTLINAEIRLPLPPLRFGSMFTAVIAPFVFTDAAIAWRPGVSGYRELEATGAGVRIAFDNPVFACFAFSYGWNPEGAGRFVFSASAKP
jgi:hypothetical protein